MTLKVLNFFNEKSDDAVDMLS